MPLTFDRPDGLHLSTQASLPQLLEDNAVRPFAGGLLHAALVATFNIQRSTFNGLSLAATLHRADPEIYPLLTALLVLDAEVHTLIDEARRILPLAAFLNYRARLPLDRVPLETVRLPPLNPDGRYIFNILADRLCLALRLDLHQRRRVAGHVRLALSSPTRPPLRLRAAENRLERQVMTAEQIEAALAASSEDTAVSLTPSEQAALVEALKQLIR